MAMVRGGQNRAVTAWLALRYRGWLSLVLLLLVARAHLRGFRSARLLRKLATQLENRGSLDGGGGP